MRLKQKYNSFQPFCLAIFQFLEGAIKALRDAVLFTCLFVFQFLEGAIKAASIMPPSHLCSVFQFLEGAIKAQERVKEEKVKMNFNSSKVRLKLSVFLCR